MTMTVDMLRRPLDLGRVLAHIGTERFFADYWQRRALSLELDAASFRRILDEVGPLDITRLASLAKGGTQAWIASEHIAHSVVLVDATNATQFFAIGATLYFLNVPMERLTGGLADFLGVPRERLIASIFYTPACGGASLHYDKHENFTVQLTGGKRWMVGSTPIVPGAMDGHVMGQPIPPSVAQMMSPVEDQAQHTVDLRPGSLLYVPRGTLHQTGAGIESWSLNLSYCRTNWLELLQNGLRRRLTGSAKWRASVTGLGRDCDPAAQTHNIFPELVAELREILSDPREIERFCQELLDKPD
jgi:ribosomal protein L16 Arg81 hydroxylase